MTPRGVSDHPEKELIEKWWKEGLRAKEIKAKLEELGLPVIATQTLARYGQRYWSTGKVVIEGPGSLAEQIRVINESGIGTVRKVNIRESVTRTGTSSAHTIEVVPKSVLPTVERAVSPQVKLNFSVSRNGEKRKGWKQGVFLPDMQIGYWGDGSEHVPTHDEAALDVAHQIMADLEATGGIDLVVNAGDNVDLPALSSHRSAPGFMQTTKAALQRTANEAAIQRALAPKSDIVWMCGNHEQRLTNYLVDKAPALVGISRAGQEEPVLSFPFLCRFDESNVKFIEPYPDGEFWVNDNFRIEHGSICRSGRGATSAAHLNSGVSVGFGHIHRQEFIQQTRHTARGPRTFFAGSPGCLCKIDGTVPSSKTGITSRGKQAAQRVEDWQQGLWVFQWQPEGDKLVSIEPISIWGGWAMWRGREYLASVNENGVPHGRTRTRN